MEDNKKTKDVVDQGRELSEEELSKVTGGVLLEVDSEENIFIKE